MARRKKKIEDVGQLVLVNELGIPLYIDKSNPSQMKDRVKLLKTVVKTEKPIGSRRKLSKAKLEKAKVHLGWYSKELEKLKEAK